MKKYPSKIAAAVHEIATDLYREGKGSLSAKKMREFDRLCLTPVVPMPPDRIRALREREEVSQVVFALHLGVTSSLVSKWERGEKHPRGASLKLLSLVEKKGLDWVA